MNLGQPKEQKRTWKGRGQRGRPKGREERARPGWDRKGPVGTHPSPPHWTESKKAGRRGGIYTHPEQQYGKGEGDLTGYIPNPKDLQLKEVYGD